jgi:HAMP domain-containing protein
MSEGFLGSDWGNPPPSRHRGIRIDWKIAATFAGVVLLCDLLAIAFVYHYFGRALREQIDQRALVVATNLSNVAAGYVATQNVLPLDAILTQYALLEGVAYTFVRDRNGEVLSYSPRTLLDDLRASLLPGPMSQPQRRGFMLNGKEVYETAAPMIGGQIGTVHVGFSADWVDRQIDDALLPLIALPASLLVAGLLVPIFLARRMIKPIIQLRSIADAMSQGDLDTPVRIKCKNEIADLAMSLERMRVSLKAAMARLARLPRPIQLDEARNKPEADR